MNRIVVGLLLLIAVTAGIFALRFRRSPHMNVLVISACSLRMDRLGVYAGDSSLTPKIDAWAKDAIVFNNAIAERPWQNFYYESNELMSPKFLINAGYKSFGERATTNRFFIPPFERNNEQKLWYYPETAILNYQKALGELRAALTSPMDKPFYIFAHVKYMHYPYLDTINMGENDWRQLTPKSYALLSKYRKQPLRYDAQLPLLALLTNDIKLLKEKLGVKTDVFALAGVVSDPVRDAKWAASADFKDDLKLAEELYDLKVKRFDSFIADTLNLYGNADLLKNTVVILTGDHGEAFMEHGAIGHSVNVYDEMLRYPLIVKFPGAARAVRIDGQVSHRQLATLVRDIMNGKATEAGFLSDLQARQPEYLLSRNCSDTIRSVRYNSQWKFVQNQDSGKNELYNLASDPHEQKNIIGENPEMAWKLEEYMMDHLSTLQREARATHILNVCTAN